VSDKSLRKDIWGIVLVIGGLTGISIAVILILTEQALDKQEHDILDQKMVTASALASRFELKMEGSVSILQFASNSGLFSEVNNVEDVTAELRGIPIDLEPEKRKILRDTYSNYRIFDTIHFMLPNGDIYILEPYDRQLALQRPNFADREYFQGAMASGQPYISNTIISTASYQRVLPIAVPAHDPNGGTTGLIVGAMNLELLEDDLRRELHFDNNNRILFVDENANVVEDVAEGSADPYTRLVSMGHLQSVQSVLAEKSGHIVEVIDGVDMLTVYQPALAHNHNWGILVMQPKADAFSAIDYLRNQLYAMLVIITIVIGASGYFLISFRTHSALARELAAANSDLMEKDKLKDSFLRVASHELRTPIQPILGYSSLAKRGMVNNDLAWNVVHKEAEKLMHLSNNIVDISMIQSGTLSYNFKEVIISGILASLVDSYDTFAKGKNVAISLSEDQECKTTTIVADSSRLLRVFEELLRNAIKFTDSGAISIQCRLAGEHIVIKFKDSGTGIPESILDRLFNAFTTVSSSDAKAQGAGLGLFICKAIVEFHHGTISASNNVDEPGATFQVSLPIRTKNMKSDKVLDTAA
jgi:signal transduction histidine kinase